MEKWNYLYQRLSWCLNQLFYLFIIVSITYLLTYSVYFCSTMNPENSDHITQIMGLRQHFQLLGPPAFSDSAPSSQPTVPCFVFTVQPSVSTNDPIIISCPPCQSRVLGVVHLLQNFKYICKVALSCKETYSQVLRF